MTRIVQSSRYTYGRPRVQSERHAQGESGSRKRVARRMKPAGLAARMKRRFKVAPVQTPKAPPAPNLLKQNFTAHAPNPVWVADITSVHTGEGARYVAAVLDLFSRRIVGLARSDRMTSDLVISATHQALTHRQPSKALIHPSDRGSQYTRANFQKLLKAHGITASLSSTRCCFDHALPESFFHTLKTEPVYFEDFQTRAQAKLSIFEYVQVFYNQLESIQPWAISLRPCSRHNKPIR